MILLTGVVSKRRRSGGGGGGGGPSTSTIYLTGSAVSDKAVQFDWVPLSTPPAGGYRLFARETVDEEEEFSLVGVTESDASGFLLSNLSPETEIEAYVVAADEEDVLTEESNAITVTTLPIIYLLGPEGFEGTGAPEGWTVRVDGANFDYTTAPISGAQSLLISVGSGSTLRGVYLPYIVPSGDDIWMRFKFNIKVAPSQTVPFVRFETLAGASQHYIQLTNDLRMNAVKGSSSGSGILQLALDTDYYLTIRRRPTWDVHAWVSESEILEDDAPLTTSTAEEALQTSTVISIVMSRSAQIVVDDVILHDVAPAEFENIRLIPEFSTLPTLTPTSGDTGTVFTRTAGAAIGAGTLTLTQEIYVDGVDVTSSMVGDTYTLPSGKAQIATVTTYDNGYDPPAIKVLSVETPKPAASGDDLARTVTAQRYAQDGVMIEFDAPRQVGHYLEGFGSGDIFVVGATQISYTPGPMVRTSFDGRAINGAVKNPIVRGISGWDSGQRTRYDAAYNAALSTISLSPGDVLVIGQSDYEYEIDAAKIDFALRTHVIVTCVAEVPYHDEFRPPFIWPASLGARPRFRMSEASPELLPSLSTTGLTVPSMAEMTEKMTHSAMDAAHNWDNQVYKAVTSPPNYGRDISSAYSDAIGFLASDGDLSDKLQILRPLLQQGIDRWGAFNEGRSRGLTMWQADGGWNWFRKFNLILAGWLFDHTGMKTAHQINLFQEDGMSRYVTQEMVDISNGPTWNPPYPTRPQEPYQQAMFDGGYPMPEWTPNANLLQASAHLNAHKYRSGVNFTQSHAQVFFLLAAGLKTTWENDAYFDYQVRHHYLDTTGVDPWVLQGGVTPIYTQPGGAEEIGSKVNFGYDMFVKHLPTLYSFPWE